jgi:hemoglobin/transferrin/lactoferrin receptor protein
MYNGWKRLGDYSPSGEDNLNYATPQGMPAWYTLNLRTGYRFNESLGIQVALENIMDQNYRVFASGVSAPGRNLVLTLKGTF